MRRITQTSLTALFTTVLGTVPVMALAADGHSEGKSLGLPQFDVATYPSQLFWMFLTFGVCYVIFSKKILPELSAIIQTRQERIESDLQTAKDLRAEIDQVRTDYEAALADARNKANGHLNDVQAKARAQAETASHEFIEKSVNDISAFESRTDTLKEKALSDIRESVAGAAADIANKTAGIDVAADDALQAIDARLGINKAA